MDKGKMTLDEAVEGLYDLDKRELIQLALECTLIANGPRTFIVYQNQSGEWLTQAPNIYRAAIQVRELVREGVSALQEKLGGM